MITKLKRDIAFHGSIRQGESLWSRRERYDVAILQPKGNDQVELVIVSQHGEWKAFWFRARSK